MGKNTFELIIDGKVEATTSIEVADDIKFSVYFERKKGYNGEFGFDWMRKNYSTIANNYEELKKEYKDAQINDQEYFVPYLSMFPTQEEVVFNLKLNTLEGKAKKDDIIKLPSKNGITVEPNEISVKDLEKEQNEIEKEKTKDDVSKITRTEIKVVCENALSEDTNIELLDKNDNPVGEIILVKNDEVYDLEIKLVKVCWDRHLEMLREDYDREIIGLEDFMINNSLNQALIKPKILNKNFDAIEHIKVNDLPNDFLTGGSFLNSKGRRGLKKISESAQNFKGIVVFYLGLEHQEIKAGDAQTFPLDDQFLFLYINSSYSRDLSHEIGHTLGLNHTFFEERTLGAKLESTLSNYEEQLTTQKLL